MSKNETGIDDASKVVMVTIVHLGSGLTARMLGDCASKLKAAKGWFKAKGISGANDVYVYAPDVRLIEVAEGVVQTKPAVPQPSTPGVLPIGEFRPADMPDLPGIRPTE